MKMLWAVTPGSGLLCALALRRRFRLAFLLRVCSDFSGVLVGLVPSWMIVGGWYVCYLYGVKVASVVCLVGEILSVECFVISVFSVSSKWGVASCGP